MRRRVITRVTTSVHSCLTAKTSSGTEFLYPSAITGGPVTACRCPLNGTFKFHLLRLNRFSNASPKPSSICACTSLSVSELLMQKFLRGFPCSVVYTCTLFFHEFSIWENRNTFPMVCKRGILIYNAHVITFSAVCTSNAKPSEMQ